MFRQTCLIVVAVVTLVGSAGAVRATQQTVTVGQTVVSWSGDWEYDPTSSMSEQVTLSQVDPVTQSIKLATYGEFADNTVSSPEQALDAFAPASHTDYFERQLAEQGTLSPHDQAALHHRRLLYHTLTRTGFTNYPEEWWHYEHGRSRYGPILTVEGRLA